MGCWRKLHLFCLLHGMSYDPPLFSISCCLPANLPLTCTRTCWSVLLLGSAPCHQPWPLVAAVWHYCLLRSVPLLSLQTHPVFLLPTAATANTLAPLLDRRDQTTADTALAPAAWTVTATRSPGKSWPWHRLYQLLPPLTDWLFFLLYHLVSLNMV